MKNERRQAKLRSIQYQEDQIHSKTLQDRLSHMTLPNQLTLRFIRHEAMTCFPHSPPTIQIIYASAGPKHVGPSHLFMIVGPGLNSRLLVLFACFSEYVPESHRLMQCVH